MRTSKYGGYTILEVLIFLAVSSLMFVSAMTAVSGRQDEVQFAQSVREFDGKLQDIINDITTGYFPANEGISCTIGAVSPFSISIASSGTNKLGTNDECLYIGKALQFAPSGLTGSDSFIYTIVGRRHVAGSDNITVKNITQSTPIAVAKPADPTFADTIEGFSLRFGLEVEEVAGDSADYGIIAIMSQFEGVTPTAGISQGQSVQIGGISGSAFGVTKTTAVGSINSLTNATLVNNPNGIAICLRDPDGRTASITVGSSGTSSTVLKIDDRDSRCP